MSLKKIKPTSNSKRNTLLIDYKKVLKGEKNKEKAPNYLFKKKSKRTGRSSHTGSITMRHQGGMQKRKYRVIDFKRYKNDNVPGKIKTIEYDPNRNSFISLVSYNNGAYGYILYPESLKIDDIVVSGDNVPISTGNHLPIKNIPVNTFIHNLELMPKKGGQFMRGAGTYGEIVGKSENGYVSIKMKSKEIRKFLADCRATIGKVGNSESNLVKLGKAGRNRWRGIRPTVRGSAMNPCDHPHGGGNDAVGIGRPSPMDPWGNKTLGKKTRRKNKITNKYIIAKRSDFKKKNK